MKVRRVVRIRVLPRAKGLVFTGLTLNDGVTAPELPRVYAPPAIHALKVTSSTVLR